MSFIWQRYTQLLQRKPMATVSVTTGILMAAGDSISQTLIEGKNWASYEKSRTLRFLIFGTFIGGPAMRLWYVSLDKLYPIGTRLAPVKMMITDQALFAPAFTGTFLTVMGLFKGSTKNEIIATIKNDGWPILKVNYLIWPAAQLINFYLIPLAFRVLYVNIIALGWNTFLAWRSEFASSSNRTSDQ